MRRRRQHQPNDYRIDGEMAFLIVWTQDGSKMKMHTLIDAADLPRVLAYGRWVAVWSNKSNSWRVAAKKAVDYQSSTVFLSRFLLDAPKGTHVDHKNHITMDNRRSNLRITDPSTNLLNRSGLNVNNTTGVRGVTRERGKWRARIRHHRRFIHLGMFPTKEDAHAAFQAKLATIGGLHE